MSQNIEDLKNKIIYRASYRGTKEMDMLMKAFIKHILNGLDHSKLQVLDEFIKFNKVFGVDICNYISSQLKYPLVVSEFSGGIKEYNASVSMLEKLNFIGQYSYHNRGIMVAFNSKIIELSTQRCFGGTDHVDMHKKECIAPFCCEINKFDFNSILKYLNYLINI